MPFKKLQASIGFAVFVFILLPITPSFAANYTYDDVNRLIQVVLEDGTIIHYSYDDRGNRIQKISNAITNNPPTADAGIDQIVEQQGQAGTNATLDGSGSSDPDAGDTLTYSWSGPFGTATGVSPVVTLPAGMHIITLMVNDGQLDSMSDTVSITVHDTTPPVVTAPADIMAEALGALTMVDLGIATASDLVDGVLITTPDLAGPFAPGNHIITWRAVDAAGNTGTALQTVTIQNSPPVAQASMVFNQPDCLSSYCNVSLDGSESTDINSDPVTGYNDISTYEWYENGVLLDSGETATVLLSLGSYNITLKITDSQGNTSQDTVAVDVDPANLSLVEVTKAEVKFESNSNKPDEMKIFGKISPPLGKDYYDIGPVANLSVGFSSLGTVIDEIVLFQLKGGNQDKWEFESSETEPGVQKAKINWDGSRFKYGSKGVKIKSNHIGQTTTSIEIELEEGTTGPITIEFGQGVTVSIAADGAVTLSPSDLESDIDDDEIEVVLPFALTPGLQILITRGTVTETVPVASYYTVTIGKFEVKARVDSGIVDPGTLVPNMQFNVRLGAEGFSGDQFIDSSLWQSKNNKFKYKK